MKNCDVVMVNSLGRDVFDLAGEYCEKGVGFLQDRIVILLMNQEPSVDELVDLAALVLGFATLKQRSERRKD